LIGIVNDIASVVVIAIAVAIVIAIEFDATSGTVPATIIVLFVVVVVVVLLARASFGRVPLLGVLGVIVGMTMTVTMAVVLQSLQEYGRRRKNPFQKQNAGFPPPANCAICGQYRGGWRKHRHRRSSFERDDRGILATTVVGVRSCGCGCGCGCGCSRGFSRTITIAIPVAIPIHSPPLFSSLLFLLLFVRLFPSVVRIRIAHGSRQPREKRRLSG